MKKVIVGLLTSATIMTASTISLGTTGTVNTDNSRVRSKAATDSTVLTLLSINEKVEVIDDSGDWYKVKADGETGYISKELLDVEEDVKKEVTNTTTENPVGENTTTEKKETSSSEESTTKEIEQNNKTDKVTITESFVGKLASEVTIKILPSINSINIAKVEKDTEITVTEIINDWCHIETASQSGWVRKNIIEKAISVTEENEQTETKEEEQTEQTTETKVGYVNVESVNLRKDKDTSSEILDGITKNTEVIILGEEDGWYKVKVKDQIGYISKKYISNKKVEEVTSRASDTARQIEQTNKEEISTPVSSTGETGTDVVEFAKRYLGSSYVSGGANPSTGFDCSGFTSYVYSNFGISLSRTSTSQANNGKSISKSELEPGDLLIFNNSSNTSVGHVGIYIGNDQFIHAANGSKGVITTSLSSSYYEARYVDARRVL